jgi:hypothetical protein
MEHTINLVAKNGRTFKLVIERHEDGASFSMEDDEGYIAGGWIAFRDVTGDNLQIEFRALELELAGDQLALALVGILKLSMEK